MFKKIIFLECDLAIRDATTYLIIANWLEKNLPVKVVIIGRNNINFFLKNFSKSIFILTPQHYLSKNFNNNNFFYILETEGYLNEKLIQLAFFEKKKENLEKLTNINNIFVWGKNTKNLLIKEYNLNQKKISVIGNPRLILFEKKNIKKNNIKIGLVSRQVSLSNFNNETNILKLYRSHLDKKRNLDALEIFSFENQIFLDIKNLTIFFKVLDAFKDFENVKFSIKTHPNENPKDYEFLKDIYKNLLISKTQDFNEWFIDIDAVITPSSSTSIEAGLKDIPVFFTGVGQKIETFYEITDGLSYKVNFSDKNLPSKMIKIIKNHNTSISEEKKFLTSIKKNYLNDCLIDLNIFKNVLSLNLDKLKFYSLFKIYLAILILDIRYILSCIKNKKKINFKYRYSPFFSKFNLKHDKLTNLIKNNGIFRL